MIVSPLPTTTMLISNCFRVTMATIVERAPLTIECLVTVRQLKHSNNLAAGTEENFVMDQSTNLFTNNN